MKSTMVPQLWLVTVMPVMLLVYQQWISSPQGRLSEVSWSELSQNGAAVEQQLYPYGSRNPKATELHFLLE